MMWDVNRDLKDSRDGAQVTLRGRIILIFLKHFNLIKFNNLLFQNFKNEVLVCFKSKTKVVS